MLVQPSNQVTLLFETFVLHLFFHAAGQIMDGTMVPITHILILQKLEMKKSTCLSGEKRGEPA